MTNREWMETLTDRQLAEFLTTGLWIKRLGVDDGYDTFDISLPEIGYFHTNSVLGIEQWLDKPQEFIIKEKTND